MPFGILTLYLVRLFKVQFVFLLVCLYGHKIYYTLFRSTTTPMCGCNVYFIMGLWKVKFAVPELCDPNNWCYFRIPLNINGHKIGLPVQSKYRNTRGNCCLISQMKIWQNYTCVNYKMHAMYTITNRKCIYFKIFCFTIKLKKFLHSVIHLLTYALIFLGP